MTADLPRAQWPVLIKDHHPGYITWEEYLAIEARLAANHTGGGARPVREGTALCQGIIICGAAAGRWPPTTTAMTGQLRMPLPTATARKPPAAAASPRTRSTTPSPACCWTRSARSRSRSRSPQPARSPPAPAGGPGSRAGRRARPLRGRPGRAGLQPGRAGEPAGRPHPGGPLGSQARRPRRSRAGPGSRPGHPPATARPGQPGETRRRPASAVARPHHHRPGPQAAAAHPDRRRHLAARNRPGQGPDRDPLAHRRRRQLVIDRPRPTGVPAHAHPGHPADPRTRPRHQQHRPGPPPHPARIPHRSGPPVRHQRRPVGPPRLPDPQPVSLPRHARSASPRPPGGWAAAPAVIYDWIETGQLDARRGPGGRLCIPWTPATRGGLPRRASPASGHLNPAAGRTSPRQHR